MEEKRIRIFHTHIEVYPYSFHENERIEKQLSLWIDAEYRYDPVAYMVHNDTLYLPRGFNIAILEKEFKSTAFTVRDPDKSKSFRGVHMLYPPRNTIQEESINFLTTEENFSDRRSFSQFALTLDTGDGKTFVTINSIVKLGERAIIITHQNKIKQQWLKTIEERTDMSPDKVMLINSSEIMIQIIENKIDADAYIYLANHQTIHNFMKNYGPELLSTFFKKIAVGIKVYDEAHLEFRNILRIDFLTNTKKTIYLTANFGRSDNQEGRLFKKCFASATKYGEETKNSIEKRKHIIYVPVLYRSNPSFNQIQATTNMYGFSALKFSKYALHEDYHNSMIQAFYQILDMAARLEGKILITTSRIDDTVYLKELIEREYNYRDKTIATINSKNTEEQNENAKNCDIICSTIKSCGTGVDIKGLRCIINLEPFSSEIIGNQLSGRLREYAPDKDTYFFDLVDLSFPACERQYNTRTRFLKKKCKNIQIFKLS